MGAKDPEALPELVEVGRVLRPHGVRGEVVVESWSDHEERFAPGAELLLKSGARLLLQAARVHHGRLLARFAGVDDRDGAERLRGAVLEVRRVQVPPAPSGCYYHFELLGCRLEDRRQGALGRVEEVVEDGGGALLRVRASGGELLVPFVRAYLVEVDVERRRILMDLPEGLIDTCVSTS